MIVHCEKCESKYRINADKLPPQGGKIRCPTCRHVFVVRPEAKEPSLDEIQQNAATIVQETQPDAESSAGESWRLKVAGLTYNFQDMDSVQQWLLNRDAVEGIKVAKEGDDFKELGDYPGLVNDALEARHFLDGKIPTSENPSEAPPVDNSPPPSARKSRPSMAGINAPKSGPSKPTSSRKAASKKSKSSRGGKKGKAAASGGALGPGGMKYVIALVVLLLVAVVGHFTGVIDLSAVLPGEPEPEPTLTGNAGSTNNKTNPRPDAGNKTNTNTGGSSVTYTNDDEPDVVEEDEYIDDGPTDEEIFQEKFGEAKVLIETKKLAEARFFLEAAGTKRPDDLELHESLLSVYEGLGKADLLKQQKAKVEALRLKKEEEAAAQKEKEDAEKKDPEDGDENDEGDLDEETPGDGEPKKDGTDGANQE